VILTDQAIELFRQAPKDAENFWSNTIGHLSDEEQDALLESLIKLKNVMEKPVWPSFEQLHPKSERYTQERTHADLEEIFSLELGFIGKCLVLAKMAEEVNQPEVAAYLKQVASEEITHALSAAKLLGRNADIKRNLIELAKEKLNAKEIRENLIKVVTAEKNSEILDFLSKIDADEANHKRWFKMLLRQVKTEN
jgi:rubrerythrin